jgi:ATP-dependent RNA helicase RhlE
MYSSVIARDEAIQNSGTKIPPNSPYKGGAKPQKQKFTRPIRALILTPTRELAIQIEESFANYGRYMNFRSKVIFGGVSQHTQVDALSKGIDILIATPGRLLDLMNQGFIDL